MPKFLEKKLASEAAAKGYSGRRADKFVYGSMNAMGVMRGNKITPKGVAMEQKHETDQLAPKKKGKKAPLAPPFKKGPPK